MNPNRLRRLLSIAPKHGRPRKNTRVSRVELLEDRRLLATIWRNPVDSLDLDYNQFVVPLDALHVINELNSVGPHALPSTKDSAKPFFDASGDQFVSPIDALLVINYLNEGAGAQRKLQEGSTLVRETDVTIGLGQAAGIRTYRVKIDATFDISDQSAALEDVLAVYLLDPENPEATILDRGTAGTALTATRMRIAPHEKLALCHARPNVVRADVRFVDHVPSC